MSELSVSKEARHLGEHTWTGTEPAVVTSGALQRMEWLEAARSWQLAPPTVTASRKGSRPKPEPLMVSTVPARDPGRVEKEFQG